MSLASAVNFDPEVVAKRRQLIKRLESDTFVLAPDRDEFNGISRIVRTAHELGVTDERMGVHLMLSGKEIQKVREGYRSLSDEEQAKMIAGIKIELAHLESVDQMD